MRFPGTVIASLCVVLLSPHAARAESATVGIEAGVTASRLSPDAGGESIAHSPGAIAGFYLVVPILKSVSFVPELLYVQKYSSRTVASTSTDVKLEYVEIPLLAKMPFLWHTYISEGVALGFPVSVAGVAQDLSRTTSPDVAIVIGGGYDMHKAAIEFRYDGGLRRLSTVTNAPVQRTRSFMVLLKLHF